MDGTVSGSVEILRTVVTDQAGAQLDQQSLVREELNPVVKLQRLARGQMGWFEVQREQIDYCMIMV
jgi:hypothetical protein